MRLRSLGVPDSPVWRADAGYSFAVRRALVAAYAHAGRYPGAHPGNAGTQTSVLAELEPLLDAPMAARQRLRVFYVLSRVAAAAGDYAEALSWLDKAQGLAVVVLAERDDRDDLLDVLALRGGMNRAALLYRDAAADYRDYLALTEDGAEGPGIPNAALTLEVLAQLAGAEFFLARYDAAARLLAHARRLLPVDVVMADDPDLRLAAASLAWFESLAHRWRNEPERAVRPAGVAARIYTETGSLVSAARGQLILADTLLDVVARQPNGAWRRAMAVAAQPHVEGGLRLAREAGDPVGESLLLLAEARWRRLAGRPGDRLAVIEQAMRVGQRFEDEAVLAQAFTALGDELAAQGRWDAALARYREVHGLLDGSDVPALGAWAARAVHLAAEYQVSEYQASP